MEIRHEVDISYNYRNIIREMVTISKILIPKCAIIFIVNDNAYNLTIYVIIK